MKYSIRWGVALFVVVMAFINPSHALAQARPTYIIAFIPLNWEGSLDEFEQAAQLQGAYFVAESGIEQYAVVEFRYLREPYTGDPTDAFLDLYITTFGLTLTPADRYIGLSNSDLAPDGDSSVVGWTRGSGALGMVVEVGDVQVTAHELGHTYDLCDEYLYEEWARQNDARGCPNPFPPMCVAQASIWCAGLPAADGRNSMMGPAGLDGGYAYNEPGLVHLHTVFEEIFGEITPVPTPTPPLTPTAPPIVLAPSLLITTPALVWLDANGGEKVLAPAPTLHPTLAPDGQSVVFSAPYAGTYDLWRVPIVGGTPEPLTEGGGREWHPAFTPDGSAIFYGATGTTVRNLYRLEVATGSTVPLVGLPVPADYPHLSATGRHLWFAAAPTSDWAIYRVALDDAGLPRIETVEQVADTAGMDIAPVLSPDGATLLFASVQGATVRLYQFDIAEGTSTSMTEGVHSAWGAQWLDERHVVYQEAHAEGMQIVLFNPKTGARRVWQEGQGLAWPYGVSPLSGAKGRGMP